MDTMVVHSIRLEQNLVLVALRRVTRGQKVAGPGWGKQIECVEARARLEAARDESNGHNGGPLDSSRAESSLGRASSRHQRPKGCGPGLGEADRVRGSAAKTRSCSGRVEWTQWWSTRFVSSRI